MSKKTFTPSPPLLSVFSRLFSTFGSLLGTSGVRYNIFKEEHLKPPQTVSSASRPSSAIRRRGANHLEARDLNSSRVDLERALSTQRVDQLSECARP